jgi:hypothetical protein
MADVFISYRKADRAKAQALANALKIENLDVWWDVALETGETFDEKIQAVLEQCKAVIVLWSKESVKSEWVRAESSIGRQRGILVPVMIQDVNIPVPFNVLHTADLVGWHGDRSHPGYRDVVKQVKEFAGKTGVKPLKPPPNRALRALWRTIAVVGVVAAIGASVWIFRPWETFIPKDPVVEAKKEAEAQRTASLNKLEAFGLKPGDLEMHSSMVIAKRIFRPETYPQLTAEAEKGDPLVLSLKCAVDLWTLSGNDTAAWEESDEVCDKAAASGEPAGLVYRGEQLLERSYLSDMGENTRVRVKEAAVAEYRKAAEAGFSFGEIRYGMELESGKVVTADAVAARALYASAQAKGVLEADFRLGLLLFGLALEDDDVNEAFAMVKKAADGGVQEAQSVMADLIADSFNTREELQERLAYLRLCTAGVDPYVAFRCREQLPEMEADIAALDAPAPEPAPAAPPSAPN